MLTARIDRERFIHSLKASIACILGLLCARYIGLPADQWIVITIVVVMCAQIYVGSVRQKAYLRFLGTLIGCLMAAVTLIIAGHNYLAILISIGFSTFIFSYLATGEEKFAYMGTLGAVTTVIIMIGNNQPTLTLALQRFLEISAGIFIAACVSQFILPIHATAHLLREQIKTLEQLRDYYIASMMPDEKNKETLSSFELDENIVKSLLRQRQLAKESKAERTHTTTSFNIYHFNQTLFAEREMLRAITFMNTAFSRLPKKERLTHTLHLFSEQFIQALNTLINNMRSNTTAPIIPPLIETLMNDLNKNIEELTYDERIQVDGFIFSAETLLKSLSKLSQLSSLK